MRAILIILGIAGVVIPASTYDVSSGTISEVRVLVESIQVTLCARDGVSQAMIPNTRFEVTPSGSSGSAVTGSTDITGCVSLTLSTPTAVDERPEVFALEAQAAFPNPAGDFVRVPLRIGRRSLVSAELFGLLGQSIARTSAEADPGDWLLLVESAALAPGLYLYVVRAGQQTIQGQFIKQQHRRGANASMRFDSGSPSMSGRDLTKTMSINATVSASRNGYVPIETSLTLEDGINLTLDLVPVGTGSVPPGPDTLDPFPLDRGDDGESTPGTYKGIWLRRTSAVELVVTPSVNGVIGVVCVGMSNSSQECDYFIDNFLPTVASEVNPAVVVVNCAVPSNAIEHWNDPTYDDQLWQQCIERRLAGRGLSSEDVRVIYHKAANQCTSDNPDPCVKGDGVAPAYPDPNSDYFNFQDNLTVFADRAPGFFPSLQAIYTTSRSYGGFSPKAARGEPLSYEEGLALNEWLVSNPEREGVWQGWGPYIWAGECGTGLDNSSGLCYVREDYEADGVHPSASGESKIAALLHARFMQHDWYRK